MLWTETPLWVQSLVLGVVQGLTEFLPISSTAHIDLLKEFMDWTLLSTKSFDVALHMGTLLALLAYFQRDLLGLAQAFGRALRQGARGNPEGRLAFYILLATFPAALAGVLWRDTVEEASRSPFFMASMLILFGLVLAWADRVARQDRHLQGMRWWEAMAVGVAQAVSLFPGVSRSGATMTAAMGLGFGREDAARFSFLLGVPIMAGGGLWEARHLLKGSAAAAAYGTGPVSLAGPVLVGVLASAVTGYLCIHFLLRYLRTGTFLPFVLYRLGLGLVVLVLVLTGAAFR
ncbi:MAG TPA: undecaprenyl-diphosphate phosphatase [Candidatus Nitrosotenuis sp.]|jgi:undecaprenyl-diphosphatase|nr:undecaprenyl-diphosphate phosphatase [Candidatus Nitrosotenuis sp.]